MVSPLSTGEFSAVPQKLYSKLPEILDVPNLIEVQLNSFRWFQEKGLRAVI